jgi:hypothetical protein
MERRQFIKTSGIIGTGMLFNQSPLFAQSFTDFENKRPPVDKRHFTSGAVEATIVKMKKQLGNKELAWLF